MATLKGHTKKVTSVIYHPSQVNTPRPITRGAREQAFNDVIGSTSFGWLTSNCCVVHYLWSWLNFLFSRWPTNPLFVYFPPPGGGVLSISRQHHPCVVGHRGQLCPGGPCPRGGRDRTVPPRHRGLPAQLLRGSGTLIGLMMALCMRGRVSVFTHARLLLQYWAFSDVQTGRVLTKVTDESAGVGK